MIYDMYRESSLEPLNVYAKIQKNDRKLIIQIKPPKMILDQTVSAALEDKRLLHSDQVVWIGDIFHPLFYLQRVKYR